MNNTRYEQAWFLRTAGIAGAVTAVVLLVNTAKRIGLLPTTDLTQLVAPVAQLAGIVLVLGLLGRSRGPSALRLGAVVANVVVFAGLVGVEVVINLVFAHLDPTTIAALRAGPLGVAFTIASLAFLAGSVLLVVALWREAPRWALLMYGAGAIPVALRAFVPEAVLQAGLIVLAAGVAGLALSLLAPARQAATA
ncbi:hypothetical protein [Promicromonospora sp. NPDC060271]|uniref:hypothetical protein n=1 Tax=Promicromonospora sp. NPDC060271 TaxID=3347089 RepID=UPI00364EB618